ncbi:hypothetical protein ROZALSC1DRAFT_26467 [Rozella allomycis CSF55]|uniref:Uncharacterized protein n=1 Tax=Rozella allomycis (strain CSF55) TaxID=988480 RepID=A0A4V1J0N0_ROZAC|nr:hypothetical protein ROZALSC1DRAFT_26467 [Rozella allomycis CSF55]
MTIYTSLANTKIQPKIGTNTNAPSTVKQVEETMQEMDKLNHTKFCDYLLNQENCDEIVSRVKLLNDECLINPTSIARALSWFGKNWSLQKCCEFLVKLLYMRGFTSDFFVNTVQEWMTLSCMNSKQILEATMMFMTAENEGTAALFFHKLSVKWSVNSKVKAIVSLNNRFRWHENYSRGFLKCLTELSVSDGVELNAMKRMLEKSKMINQESMMMNYLNHMYSRSVNSYQRDNLIGLMVKGLQITKKTSKNARIFNLNFSRQ